MDGADVVRRTNGTTEVDADRLRAIIDDTRFMVADILRYCERADAILLREVGVDAGADAVARAERALAAAREQHAHAETALATAKRKADRAPLDNGADLPDVDRALRGTHRMLLDGPVEKELRWLRSRLQKKSEHLTLTQGLTKVQIEIQGAATGDTGLGPPARRETGVLRALLAKMGRLRALQPEAQPEDLADEVLKIYTKLNALRSEPIPAKSLRLSSASGHLGWQSDRDWHRADGIARIKQWLVAWDNHDNGESEVAPSRPGKFAAELLELKKDTLTEANRLWFGKGRRPLRQNSTNRRS
jgi:hypothetical protein